MLPYKSVSCRFFVGLALLAAAVALCVEWAIVQPPKTPSSGQREANVFHADYIG